MRIAPVQVDGRLTGSAMIVLHTVSGVRMDLLRDARIRAADWNWLRAPWYRRARGGALTMGRSIYFTRRYFDPRDRADGSLASTWAWLRLLAHEVGHLPQAERFGYSAWGIARYLAAFTAQYGARALTLRGKVHDGAPFEIEADQGRWVLMRLVTGDPDVHPLVQAVHRDDPNAAAAWITKASAEVDALRRRYSTEAGMIASIG